MVLPLLPSLSDGLTAASELPVQTSWHGSREIGFSSSKEATLGKGTRKLRRTYPTRFSTIPLLWASPGLWFRSYLKQFRCFGGTLEGRHRIIAPFR